MTKRMADWLEKTSVAAFAVGVFQTNSTGIIIAAIALSGSMWLTQRLEVKS